MGVVPELHTTRLRLVPGTVGLFDADLAEPDRLAALLGVTELSDWPPTGSDYDRDAIEVFRAQLLADPRLVGWNSYYACWGDALVGCGGYFGPPAAGAVEIGYAIGRPWRRLGLASELVGALLDRASSCGVERVVAHTRPDNAASKAVLAGNGFLEVVSDQSDHLRFERELTAARRSAARRPTARSGRLSNPAR
jgi:RimJ/RimL family protein N-acetyltransferase